MDGGDQSSREGSWKRWLSVHGRRLTAHEDQIFLVLTLVIGALTGLTVVAFILLTERLGMRLYPVGGAPWRRPLFPVVGSFVVGYLLFRYFPEARGSGIPQTKAALYAHDGRITLRTLLGKFFLHICNTCQWNPTRARRSIGTSWRGHRFSTWTGTAV